MSTLLWLFVVLVIVAVLFGAVGSRAAWGLYGWSPLGIVLLILVVLWLAGALR
jgi:hypothetical protein